MTNDICIDVGLTGVGTTARIDADGSASFAGLTEWNDGGLRCRINPNGINSGGELNLSNSAYSTKISLFGHNGSASFAGNITAGNVSDIKFKENITDANPQLSDVVALGSNLKNWDWKEEAPLNDELKAKRFLF